MSDINKPLLDYDESGGKVLTQGYPANEIRGATSIDDAPNAVQPARSSGSISQPPPQPQPSVSQTQPPIPQQTQIVTYQNNTIPPPNYPPRAAIQQNTPHIYATTLDYILCGRCRKQVAYPTGSALVKCPYCEAINNTAPAMSTTQCFRCGKFLLFPSTAKGISCPCGEIITLQHVYSSPTPPDAYLQQQQQQQQQMLTTMNQYPPPQ